MTSVYSNMTQLIGNTPLVLLQSYSTDDVQIYAKLENMNPGGSIKDRLGSYIIETCIQNGTLQKGMTIIEATAGNTGIGLALAAKKYGLHVYICVPETFSVEKQMLMKALGATLFVTPSEEGMDGAIKKAKQLFEKTSDSYFLNQFENYYNPLTYYETLGPELWEQLAGNIDIFIAGAGTGGTFTGTSQYLKERNAHIKTVIVEPEGSILNGGIVKEHKVEGIGMSKLSPFMDVSLFDAIHTVTDEEAFQAVQDLAKKEGILAGSSSGCALIAAIKEAAQLKRGAIVVIFPDGAERYLSKNIYGGIH